MAKEKDVIKKKVAKNKILMQLKELKHELAKKQKKLERIEKAVEARRRKSYNDGHCSSSQGTRKVNILSENGNSFTEGIPVGFPENFETSENFSVCNISDSDEPSVLSQTFDLKIPLDPSVNSMSPHDDEISFCSNSICVGNKINCSKHVDKVENSIENTCNLSHMNEADALQDKCAIHRLNFTAVSAPSLCAHKVIVKRNCSSQEPFPENKFQGQGIRLDSVISSACSNFNVKKRKLDCVTDDLKIEKVDEGKCDVQEAVVLGNNNNNVSEVKDTSLDEPYGKNANVEDNNAENMENINSLSNEKVSFEDLEISEDLKNICSKDFDFDYDSFDVSDTYASKCDKLNNCDVSKLFSTPQFVPLSALVAKIELEHEQEGASAKPHELHCDSFAQQIEENMVLCNKTSNHSHLSPSKTVGAYNEHNSTNKHSVIQNNEAQKLSENSYFFKTKSTEQTSNWNNCDIQQTGHTVQRLRTSSDTFAHFANVNDNKENCEPGEHNKQQKSSLDANLKPMQKHVLYGVASKDVDNNPVRKYSETSANLELSTETPLDISRLHPGYFVPLSKLRIGHDTVCQASLKVPNDTKSVNHRETSNDCFRELQTFKNIDHQSISNHIACDNDMNDDLDLLNDNFIFNTESSLPVEEVNANLETVISSTQKSKVETSQSKKSEADLSPSAQNNQCNKPLPMKFNMQDNYQSAVIQLGRSEKVNTYNGCTYVKSVSNSNVDCLADDMQDKSNCNCRVIFQCSVNCFKCQAHSVKTKDVAATISKASNAVNSLSDEELHKRLLMCDDSFVVPLSSSSKFDNINSENSDQRHNVFTSPQHSVLDKVSSSAKSENNELLTQNLLRYLQDEDFEEDDDGNSQPVGNAVPNSPDGHQKWLRLSRGAKVNVKPAICVEDIIPEDEIEYTCSNDGSSMLDEVCAKSQVMKSECIDKVPTEQFKDMIAVLFSHTYFIILFTEFEIFVYQYNGLHWIRYCHWSFAKQSLSICKGFHVQNADNFVVGVILKTPAAEIDNKFFLMNCHELASSLLQTSCKYLQLKEQSLLPYISIYCLDGLAFISSVMTGYSPVMLNEFYVDNGKFKLVSYELDFTISPFTSICSVEFFPHFVTLKNGKLSMWKYSSGSCSHSDVQCNLPPCCKVIHVIFDGTEWCLLLVMWNDRINGEACKLVLVSLKKELTYDVCSYKLFEKTAEVKHLGSEIKAVVAGDNLVTFYRNNCKVFYLWTGEELASISCKSVSTVAAVERLIAFHYQEGCLRVLFL